MRVNPGIEAHTHEFIATGQEDSKFGFSLASGAAERRSTPCGACEASRSSVSTPTSGASSCELESFARRRRGARASRRGPRPRRAVRGWWARGRLPPDEEAPTIEEWADAVHAQSAGGTCAQRPGHRGTGARHRRDGGGDPATGSGRSRSWRGPQLRRRRRGYERQPPAGPLRERLEAFLPRWSGRTGRHGRAIVGKHCESGDVVVAEARLPGDVKVGDALVTPVTGAYGFSMASNYNRVGRPAVVFVGDGRAGRGEEGDGRRPPSPGIVRVARLCR